MFIWLFFSIIIRMLLVFLMLFFGLQLYAVINSSDFALRKGWNIMEFIWLLTIVGVLFFLFQFCLPT